MNQPIFDPMGFTLFALVVAVGAGTVVAVIIFLIGDARHRRKRATR